MYGHVYICIYVYVNFNINIERIFFFFFLSNCDSGPLGVGALRKLHTLRIWSGSTANNLTGDLGC